MKARARPLDYVGGAIRSVDGTSFTVNGVADHIHILARLRQDKALSDILRDIKANSSGWIHADPGAFGSYAVCVECFNQYARQGEYPPFTPWIA